MDRENHTSNPSYVPYKVYNIGNHNPVRLMDFIKTFERHLGLEAKKDFIPSARECSGHVCKY
jgi:UDP-glucuronate 4-epimerase